MDLQLRGVEAHLTASLRIDGPNASTLWSDINVSQWDVENISVPHQED